MKRFKRFIAISSLVIFSLFLRLEFITAENFANWPLDNPKGILNTWGEYQSAPIINRKNVPRRYFHPGVDILGGGKVKAIKGGYVVALRPVVKRDILCNFLNLMIL
jgi:murein DD-endopeptidase MepM/ murein hydrolase activator NlpD